MYISSAHAQRFYPDYPDPDVSLTLEEENQMLKDQLRGVLLGLGSAIIIFQWKKRKNHNLYIPWPQAVFVYFATVIWGGVVGIVAAVIAIWYTLRQETTDPDA